MSGPDKSTLPPFALGLGWAGLLPQVAVVGTLLVGGPDVRFTALSIGFGYAALIFSFLGGLWWWLAATGGERTPPWTWVPLSSRLGRLAVRLPLSVGLGFLTVIGGVL